MNIYLFFSCREKSTFVFLGSFCFLPENLEGKCSVCFLKQTWLMICHRIYDMTGSQLNSKKVSLIYLSILVHEFVKVKVAEVQLAVHCSKWQNLLPLRGRTWELLLLKSVFKANILNVLFTWGWTKTADNHSGTDQ